MPLYILLMSSTIKQELNNLFKTSIFLSSILIYCTLLISADLPREITQQFSSEVADKESCFVELTQ